MSEIKNAIQSSHLNFLFGSGLSAPFLKTLGDVEQRLTELDKFEDCTETVRSVMLASIRKLYFEKCISANLEILKKDASCKTVQSTYRTWLATMNQILLNRKSTLLNKQVNLFTTNMDVFPEMALEELGAEFNDGFYGKINPRYDLSNFKKSVSQTSQQYSVAAEIPLFNLYKLHGSVSWKIGTDNVIELDRSLDLTNFVKECITGCDKLVLDILDSNYNLISIQDLAVKAKAITSFKEAKKINDAYEKLVMVNPTKDKFKLTTLNKIYYELLRMYSNELEKENAVLFVMGFSFADEHITEITKRAVKSNPTLKVYIFAYDKIGEEAIRTNLGIEGSGTFSNICIMPRLKEVDTAGVETGETAYNLTNIINQHFHSIARDKNG